MHRAGKYIVKFIKIARSQQGVAVEQAGVLGQLLQRLGHHGLEKHAGVHLPIKALANRPATGRQIQRCAHRRHGSDHLPGLRAHFARPTHQRIPAQRNSHGDDRPVVLAGKAPEQPVDFSKIAGMIGTRCQVEFARATAKVRHGTSPSPATGNASKGLGIVAGR